MAETAASKTEVIKFGGVTPVLPVRSLSASVDYYVGTLEFKLDWQDSISGFVSVSRGCCNLFLCEGDQGHFGTWVWIGVEDADTLWGSIAPREPKYGIHRQIIPGLLKFRWKTWMETSCGWARNRNRMELAVNGLICEVIAGFCRQMADGYGPKVIEKVLRLFKLPWKSRHDGFTVSFFLSSSFVKA